MVEKGRKLHMRTAECRRQALRFLRHLKHHHITLTTGPAAPAAAATPGPDPPPELSNLGKKSAQYYRCAGEPVVQLLASQPNMQSAKVQFGSKHTCWGFSCGQNSSV